MGVTYRHRINILGTSCIRFSSSSMLNDVGRWKRNISKSVRGNGDFLVAAPISQYRAVLALPNPPLPYLAGASRDTRPRTGGCPISDGAIVPTVECSAASLVVGRHSPASKRGFRLRYGDLGYDVTSESPVKLCTEHIPTTLLFVLSRSGPSYAG